ncbi:MAG: bifunctional riboflavin kinase/FAD synthetase [Burkholderiales bacterium]|nr:bifunctional riboflavin kinase/FAD synthetase [Burkholderiales bacterium]
MLIVHRPKQIGIPSAITIGNFDGVHAGHAVVLRRLVALAKQQHLTPTVVTFAPNPKAYFAHKRGVPAPTQIMPLRDKVATMKALGVEQVVVLPFDSHLASMSAEAFVSDILIERLNAKLLLVGDDFRFGAQRKGDFALLQSLQSRYGYVLENLHSVEQNGVRISSSAIREHLASGEVAQAIQMLGHPLTLSGHVIHGEKLGRTIGVPTINIKMPERLALQGIYAASVQLQSAPEKTIQGAASIGVRPSVKTNGQCWCEVHLFDFNQEIYGQIACVTLHQKIRDEAKFDDFDELLNAIQNDMAQCRAFFAQK